MPLNGNNYSLMEVNERMDQLDGDGTIEERCSSITFEDIFLMSQICNARMNNIDLGSFLKFFEIE